MSHGEIYTQLLFDIFAILTLSGSGISVIGIGVWILYDRMYV